MSKKDELELLKARMSEFQSDPLSVLRYLADLRDRCNDGIIQEKLSVTEGVMPVLERYPAVELAATKAMWDIYKWVDKELAQVSESSDITVKIEVVPLEVDPTLTEASFYDKDLS